MSSQQPNQKIRLKRKVNDVQIEVWIDSENEFREGYALLNRLCLRAEIEELRLHTERVWIRDIEGKRIDETITESVHRVALSLLEDWPEPKSVSDTQNETRLSQGSVSNILAGRQGGAGDWFVKQGELWNLSTKGVSEVRNLITSILSKEET
ncbi:MAG: hypothetical protein ACXACG_12190 [Candidatus Thorarchaeota archaeon]